MKSLKNILLLLLVSTPLIGYANQRVEISTGNAIDSNGDIKYVEKHISTFTDNRLSKITTLYYDNKGTKLGELVTEFNKKNFVPNYKFEDKRLGRMVKLNSDTGSAKAELKADKSSDLKKAKFEIKPNMVAGQGLHFFLVENLKNFDKNPTKKNTKNVEFLIPLNEDSYNFRIVPIFKQSNTLALRIEADSWFFRLLAPHIDVTYNTKNGRLLKYKGPSNLLDENGNTMSVEIEYSYEES